MGAVFDPILNRLRTSDAISATTDIVAKSLTVTNDVEVTTASKGIILKDANGVRQRQTQEIDGSQKTEVVP